MAASLPITCAINDAYGIFLDGRVYEEEADASYIGDEMCTVQEPIVAGNGAVVNGGFEAGRRTAVPSNDTSGIDVGEAVSSRRAWARCKRRWSTATAPGSTRGSTVGPTIR